MLMPPTIALQAGPHDDLTFGRAGRIRPGKKYFTSESFAPVPASEGANPPGETDEPTARRHHEKMGAGPDLGRILHGRARRAGGHDRAADDPAGPFGIDRDAGMDRQRLQSDLRDAAAHRRGARRPLRTASGV